MKIHNGVKIYKCSYTSAYASNFRVHLKTHRIVKCNHCDFTSEPPELRTHVKVHANGNPNKCKLCDKIFSQGSGLRTHMKIHVGEKANKCEHCDYASSSSTRFKNHALIHTGQKSNKCN